MDDGVKAKRLLDGKGFTVYYVLRDSEDEPRLLKEVVYPDYIPGREEEIIIDDNKYIVYGSVFKVDENELFISVMTSKIYLDKFHRRIK